MSNKEAIECIKKFGLYHAIEDLPHSIRTVEAFEMAIKALEKQIPKKPIRIDKNEKFDGNCKWVCPSCRKTLVERITTSEESYPIQYNTFVYCWCGQKIDWSEK